MDAVCIASGPSLTAEDVDLVICWRAQEPDRRLIIVTNTSFRICPTADAVFGMDERFWKHYGEEVVREFHGKRYSASRGDAAARYAESLIGRSGFQAFGNSGAGALMLARYLKCSRIVMLGYDCQKLDGEARHWHGDHPAPMSNAASMKSWPMQFARAARHLTKVEVVNASRRTALKCFKRASLESALGMETDEGKRSAQGVAAAA